MNARFGVLFGVVGSLLSQINKEACAGGDVEAEVLSCLLLEIINEKDLI